jgi:GAF domain-containing protein
MPDTDGVSSSQRIGNGVLDEDEIALLLAVADAVAVRLEQTHRLAAALEPRLATGSSSRPCDIRSGRTR